LTRNLQELERDNAGNKENLVRRKDVSLRLIAPIKQNRIQSEERNQEKNGKKEEVKGNSSIENFLKKSKCGILRVQLRVNA